MTIYYLGHASFKVKGKDATLVIDPYDPQMGKTFPKQSDIDIVLTSHGHYDHHYTEGISGDFHHVDGPGEYDIKNVTINGIFSYHDKSKGSERGINTIYCIDLEGVRLCHLGDLGDVLTEDQIEKIGAIDILFIPVGGKYTIDAAEAAKVIAQVGPSIAIPMHYGNTKLGLDDVSVFLKEMGVEKEVVKTLKVTKEDFSDTSEGTKVIVMEQ